VNAQIFPFRVRLSLAAACLLALSLASCQLTPAGADSVVFSVKSGTTHEQVSASYEGPGLSYSADAVLLAGKPMYLWSGELPYYRIPPDQWADRLEKARRAGINVITAYVPWNLHEYAEGRFDFTGESGDGRRNLVGFIELIARMGMEVILKPGPFICAEVRHGGIPDWLTAGHPEIIMKDAEGRDVRFREDGTPLPDYLNETYVAFVSRWYQALFDSVISRFQHGRGPIVALQVENEMIYSTSELSDPFSWGYTESVTALFQQWLEKTYGNISRFDLLHGMALNGFSAVTPPRRQDWEKASGQSWLLVMDWLRFKEWYGAAVLKRYAGILTGLGVHVPLYHNAGMLEDEPPMGFGRISKELWLGVNFWLRPHPLASFQSYVRGMRRLKQLKGSQPDRPAFAAELNWGWGSAEEFDFLTRYTMPFSKATNVYTLADGDSAGTLNGRSYSNNREPYPGSAPIDVQGNLRPAYWRLSRLTHYTLGEGERFARALPLSAITLGCYPPYNYPSLLGRPGRDAARAFREWFPVPLGANESLQGIMQGFIESDMEYDVVDLRWASAAELAKRRMIIAFTQGAMDDGTQQALIDYVAGGGTLVLFPTPPSLDLEGRADSRLRDSLLAGLEITAPSPGTGPRSVRFSGYPDSVQGKFVTWTVADPLGQAKVLGVDARGSVVAVEKPFQKGKIIYIGTYIDDPGLFRWLAEREGLTARYAWSNDRAVEVVPIADPETRDTYLFAMNRGFFAREVTITSREASNQNTSLAITTRVAGHSCSILGVSRGRLVSASLNGGPDTAAWLGTTGIGANGAAELDMVRRGPGEIDVLADRGTRVTLGLPLPDVKEVRVTNAAGIEIPFKIAGNVLSFAYEPQPGAADYYRIQFSEGSGPSGESASAP
jgi:beta-galactosidase